MMYYLVNFYEVFYELVDFCFNWMVFSLYFIFGSVLVMNEMKVNLEVRKEYVLVIFVLIFGDY